MSRRHRIPALLAVAALSLGTAACGGSGDRDDVDQSNEGQLTAPGSPSTVEPPASGLTSTGETPPPVTQPQTEP